PLLVDHFIKKCSGTPRRLSPDAMNLLMHYPWKGNVRELENIIERVLLLTDEEEITPQDIPLEVSHTDWENTMFPKLEKTGIDLDAIVEGIEKKYLLEALHLTDGTKTEAAKLLNLSFRSFRHRLQKYGIK
ncbi:MAG TPA: helix-turn-helix domain-containing protein, partial [Thermodesulfovibrionales bacterium]|nr:helix-turn-helix domain-containing protein [Thermodesulfovibrionales bacterium]